MSKQEFVLLIPAIIYGVAIVDLLKTFRTKIYWELPVWGVYMLMNSIILALTLFGQLDAMAQNNMILVLVVVQAILFSKAATIITPEDKDVDTRAYLDENYKYFIGLVMGVFLIAWINEFIVYDDRENVWVRPLGLTMALISIVWKNPWYRRVFMILLLISSFAVLFGIVR